MTRSVAVGIAVLLFASLAVAPAVATPDVGATRLGTPDGFTQTVFPVQLAEQSDSVPPVGDRQFRNDRPRVVSDQPSAVSDVNGGPADGAASSPAAPTRQSNGDMLVLVGVLVVVFGLVGAAVWQSGALSGREGIPSDSAAEAAGTAAEPVGTDSETAGVPDEELLSDSDRVVKLLEDSGGRMKQVKIVEETEWSKSKVSMLLSEMEDEGKISKLRVGRENIVSLAGHEPDAAGSPFDDEE